MSNRNQFILGLILLLGSIGLGAWQFSIMRAYNIEADSLTAQVSNLAIEKASYIEDYQSIKTEVADDRDSATQELSLVYPSDEDLTNLTRLFDDFATKNNFNSNPFFISNLSYHVFEVNEDATYAYVPLTLNISTSKRNLEKFLEFIESSGSLEGEIRLMSVEELLISYPEEYGGTYSVSMEIYAYFDHQ